jgi:pimeloyl-ACP methyl ester carboxylesterase
MPDLPEQLGFTTAYFDLPGLRMHAAVAGPVAGLLLILLHGFPDFWYGWRNQIGTLAEAGFRVVAPDQRGYNLAGKLPPYDTWTLANDLVNLISACGREQAHVVGHDRGGGAAWTLAGLYPERLKKPAILNAPHPATMIRAVLGRNLKQMHSLLADGNSYCRSLIVGAAICYVRYAMSQYTK